MNNLAFQIYGTKKASPFQSVWDTRISGAGGTELASIAATAPLFNWSGTNLLTGGYTHTTGIPGTLLFNSLTPTAGQSYQIVSTLSAGTTGSLVINWGGVSSVPISATTTITLTPINGTSKLSITPSNDFTGNVRLSIKASSSAANQIQLPITSIASGKLIWIDWGDNSYTNINSDNRIVNRIHTYSAPGEYAVRILGDNFNFIFDFSLGVTNDRLKIKSISSWGKFKLIPGSFRNCSNVTMSGITDIPDLSGVTSFNYTFAGCSAITTVGRMNEWNTSSVTNMSNMFEGAGLFNQPIGAWDVSNVTTMANMFQGGFTTMSFNQNIGSWNVEKVVNFNNFMGSGNAKNLFNNGGSPDINNWVINTKNDVDMSGMFYNSSDFNQPLNLWNTSRVTNMIAMFGSWVSPMKFNNGFASGDGIGNQLPWNTSGVTNMSGMFSNNTAFNSNLGTGTTPWDVSKVTNFSNMFNGASKFNNGDEITMSKMNNWSINTTATSVTMVSMFQSASVFNRAIESWNVSRVTNTSAMFQGAIAFNQDINSWNVSGVTNMNTMFYQASVFNQPLTNWESTGSTLANVVNMQSMFQAANAFNQPIGNWNVSGVTNMYQMFNFTTAFNQDISSWNVGKVTTFERMFRGASAFNNKLNENTNPVTGLQGIDGWNINTASTASVNMQSMFDNTRFNQYIGSWDVSRVNNMSLMFGYNNQFNQDISKWNVSGVTNFNQMFQNATVFNNGLNENTNPVTNRTGLNGWDINTTATSFSMGNMFSVAQRFNRNINDWNTTKVTNMSAMFSGANDFNQPLSGWNVSKVTNMSYMFQETYAFNQPLSNWERVSSPDTSTLANVTNMLYMFSSTAFNNPIGNWNISGVTNFTGFMQYKTALTFSYLDNLYNGWSSLPSVKPNISISFGGARYTSVGTSARNTLTSPPNNWIIADGGIAA